MSATMIVANDRKDVDPNVWTPAHFAIIKAAAQDPEVERIFVNAAIKKALCREAGSDRDWLHKVRAYWGHDYHFHVRISCPADSPDCKPQQPPPSSDGCGKDLDWWFTDAVLHPKPSPVAGEAAAADQIGRSAGRLPAGTGRALGITGVRRRSSGGSLIWINMRSGRARDISTLWQWKFPPQREGDGRHADRAPPKPPRGLLRQTSLPGQKEGESAWEVHRTGGIR